MSPRGRGERPKVWSRGRDEWHEIWATLHRPPTRCWLEVAACHSRTYGRSQNLSRSSSHSRSHNLSRSRSRSRSHSRNRNLNRSRSRSHSRSHTYRAGRPKHRPCPLNNPVLYLCLYPLHLHVHPQLWQPQHLHR